MNTVNGWIMGVNNTRTAQKPLHGVHRKGETERKRQTEESTHSWEIDMVWWNPQILINGLLSLVNFQVRLELVIC